MNDLELYKKAISVLSRGENIALITVISTTGSTPGKAGYKMLVWGKNGETISTVGGGLTEANVINIAKKTLPKTKNQVVKFNLDGTEDEEKGICGGSIEFLIETLDKNSLPLFKDLSSVIENGAWGAVVSIICPNKAPEKILLKSIEELDTTAKIKFSPEVTASVKELVAKKRPAKKTLEDGAEIFIETIDEQPMILIFGGGHLSYHISRFAKSVNFRFTVCDNRVEFANKNRFPDASNIIAEGYESIFDKIDINENSYIVIVTQGHKFDEIVLERAVKTNAKYIGMIGSKRKTLTILKNLQKKGISTKTLKRIYSPIGISIGAFTPEEIALSIVSELIKIRRLGDAPEINHMRITLPEEPQEGNL